MKRFVQILLVILISAFLLACGMFHNTDKFDSEKWKKSDIRMRGKMVYDLQDSRLLIGKNEQEVVDLLGKEDFLSPNIKIYVIDTNTFSDNFLFVRFDESVRKVSLIDIGD